MTKKPLLGPGPNHSPLFPPLNAPSQKAKSDIKSRRLRKLVAYCKFLLSEKSNNNLKISLLTEKNAQIETQLERIDSDPEAAYEALWGHNKNKSEWENFYSFTGPMLRDPDTNEVFED